MTPQEAYIKCRKRDKELELIIIKDPEYAYYYAKEVIKGRWIEAENIIATSSLYAYFYALKVIKSKLPENMHNAMLIHADDWSKLYFNFINADHYAKLYFNYIKNKPQP